MGHLIPGAHGNAIQIEALRVPGKNSWLVILYALLVWREWIGHGKVDDWNAAVADVRWVMIQLCDSLYYNTSAKVPSSSRGMHLFILSIGLADTKFVIDCLNSLHLMSARATPRGPELSENYRRFA